MSVERAVHDGGEDRSVTPPHRPAGSTAATRAATGAYRLAFDVALRRTDPERAHHLGSTALVRTARLPGVAPAISRLLAPPRAAAVTVAGIELPGRFGLAAGFDKEAVGVAAWSMLGFAFTEVGTITALPQEGNARPRLWREGGSNLRNAMGFNNAGAVAVQRRLAALRATPAGRAQVVGVNIGKSRVVPVEAAAADYARTATLLAPHADYVVVNVSSPNTPGLRDLQAVDRLAPVLVAVREAVSATWVGRARDGVDRAVDAGGRTVGASGQDAPGGARRQAPPVLVKIAPDLADGDVDAVADLVADLGLAGVVAVNTTIAHDRGAGGLSGPVLLARGLEAVARLRTRLGPGAMIIGVGGVSTGDDALAYRRAGADLVAGYTGFVHRGAAWAREVNRALAGT